MASARARGCSRRWRNFHDHPRITWVSADRNCDRAQKQPHTCCVGGQSRDGVTRHLSQQTSRGARAALPTSRPLLVPLTPCYPPPPPVSSTTFTLPSRERPSWSLPLPSGDHLYPPSLNNEVQDAHSPQAIQPHPAPAGWQADDCWFDSYGVVYVGLAPDVAVGESVPTVDFCVVS